MRWVAVVLFGAALCTSLDHQHVVWGVLTYASPDFWQQAWWVPVLFAVATLGALATVEPMRRMLGGADRQPLPTALVLVDVASFAAAYYLTSVAHHTPDLLTAALVGTWLLRVAAGVPGWAIAYCIGSALAGPAVEATISATGVFHYLDPDFIGVTQWLPALYLHVGVAAVSLASLLRAPARLPEAIEIEVPV